MDRIFENQTNIGWLKALMGLLAKNWSEVQNLHIQFLGSKTSGKIWISLLIRKIWDVAWEFWNFRNNTLHGPEGPRKLDIIDLINKGVTRHLEKGSIGLPTQFHFLFHTSIHTLLTRPIRKRLPRLQSTPAQYDASAPNPPEEYSPTQK